MMAKIVKTAKRTTRARTATPDLGVVTRAELLRVAEFIKTVAMSGTSQFPPANYGLVDIAILWAGDTCEFVDLPETVGRGDVVKFTNRTDWFVRIGFSGPGAAELQQRPQVAPPPRGRDITFPPGLPGPLVQPLTLKPHTQGGVLVSRAKIPSNPARLNLSLKWSKDGGAPWHHGAGGGPGMDIQDP
jgi:hypothetical protein